ncbi:MAG: response regulator transcription factor [Candidatus Wallbacteria bacterium]|nr:response regulator transcription factor [Candidatus Wallbacteria bacterium]
MERIFVIDDDKKLCELLTEYLSTEGFEVETVNDGLLGIEQGIKSSYDLIILDVMLPGINGFEVLRQLHGKVSTPVIMLTARGEDVDRIVGLEMGADDYLPKPFNPRELVARIRAILRRVKPEREETNSVSKKIRISDLEMDLGSREVYRSGERMELTSVEFSLLEKLLKNAGELVTREELVREVLGRAMTPYDRSIDVHVSKLRKKLGSIVDGMERIKTIRSVGYLYALAQPENSGGNQETDKE